METQFAMIRRRHKAVLTGACGMLLALSAGLSGGCGSGNGSGPSGKQEMPEFAKKLMAQMEEKAAKQKAAMNKQGKRGPVGRR